jgi:hypothetical protein
MNQLVTQPHPFKQERFYSVAPEGLTVAEIVEREIFDPILRAHAHVTIEDVYIPRDNWHLVRPNPNRTVYIKILPQGGGGGGGGGKNPLRTILTIAVVVASVAFGGPLASGLGIQGVTVGGFAISAASIGGAIISIAGTLLINVIAPIRPPQMATLSSTQTLQDSPTLFIEGARNAVRRFETVPVVLGSYRQTPPLGALSYTEVIGGDNYLRMLLVWGYGPLKVENIRIGETPITDFDGVQIETREGRTGDAAVTLFPDSVEEDSFAMAYTEATSFTRSAPTGADELSVDITFPQGIFFITDSGSRVSSSVSFKIEFREVGSAIWLDPTFTAATSDHASGAAITITAASNAAVRHGYRWSVASRGDYEVRVTRTSALTGSTRRGEAMAWTALRSITDEDPINFPFPLAHTALIIKATDQLNRVVDELNADVSSYVDSYTGTPGAWSEAVSSNPADLFRHVLQGNGNARPLADARIDIDGLEDWHDYCAAQGFEFNMVRDFQTSVWDTLADIASAGRASPTQIDGKWSVVVDKPQATAAQHFTPRNSSGFEAEKGFPDQPHALRIRFPNRNKNFEQDERIVYNDGYSEANATKFESIDALGITDPGHIWKYGRFHLAQAAARPERWSFNVDFENLVATRGDKVLVTHDVILVGLQSGRIKSLITGGGNVTGFVSDEVLTMEAGTNYGVNIRAVSNANFSKSIVTNAGDQTTITFTTPFATGTIAEGDIFSFGVAGLETIEGLVLSIEPSIDLAAKIICIPYAPDIYTSDTGTIPTFDSKITLQARIAPVDIISVISDETQLQLGSGNTLIPHISISFQDISDEFAVLDTQIRATGTGENFQPASIMSQKNGNVILNNVEEGATYDIRMRYRDPQRLPGAWATISGHTVIGQSSAPAGLQNLQISVAGGNAILRWDRPEELDVRFGGQVKFRHAPDLVAADADWPESTSIGTTAKGDALIATLPLKPGTYLARVFDRNGHGSQVIAKVATKQASVLAFANVTSLTEHPNFTGPKTDVVLDGTAIKLAGAGLLDAQPDVDAIADFDALGGVKSTGTYDFASGFDLTTVKRVRLTSSISAISINPNDLVDERTALLDDWEDFDGTLQASSDCRVQVRETDDDPAASPTWSAWNNLDSAEFEARGFDFRAILTTDDPAFNTRVSELSVVAEEI